MSAARLVLATLVLALSGFVAGVWVVAASDPSVTIGHEHVIRFAPGWGPGKDVS